MRQLIDKTILFLLCTLLLPSEGFTKKAMFAGLIMITVTSLMMGLEYEKMKIALVIGYLIACFVVPEFAIFLPVLFYDVCYEKLNYMIIITLFVILISYTPMGLKASVLVLLLLGVGFLLQYRYAKELELEKKMREIRDDGMELTLLLQQKNHDLLEKQDNEVYLATLQERNRIAREIHDNVGHLLTRSILQVGALKSIYKESVLQEQLLMLHETLNTAMTSIRDSVHDLHDESVDLYTTLDALVKQMPEKKVTLDYDMGKDIPKNIKYCYISIVKEALNNVAKHSNADRVVVTAREHPGFYQLMITDNGTNIKNASGQGIGLSNIQDRVKALNGNLKISTNQGFRILISILKRE